MDEDGSVGASMTYPTEVQADACERTKDVSVMLQGRKSLMRIISTNKSLREDLGLKPRDSLLNEANVLLRNSAMFRRLGSFEESLSTVTLLSSTTKALNGEGIKADAAVTYEISNALQDRGELVSSINMLRELDHTCDFGAQDIATSPSEIVATLVSLYERWSGFRD